MLLGPSTALASRHITRCRPAWPCQQAKIASASSAPATGERPAGGRSHRAVGSKTGSSLATDLHSLCLPGTGTSRPRRQVAFACRIWRGSSQAVAAARVPHSALTAAAVASRRRHLAASGPGGVRDDHLSERASLRTQGPRRRCQLVRQRPAPGCLRMRLVVPGGRQRARPAVVPGGGQIPGAVLHAGL
jgi:hypothetical protein